jgi:predicted transcriptional regulator
MIPQIPLDLIAPVVSRVKEKRIKLSYVFPRNVIVPRGRKELLRKLGFSELLNSGLVERRMVDNVQVAVVINEKQASVLFPTQKGETDMNLMFYSENPLFHEWALDYFRYRWYGSDPFDESKLKEI